jgi:hypothetical protein
MAYKFQLGAARMSGSLVQEGRLDAEGIVSGSGALQGASVAVDGNITAGLTISGSMLDGQIQNPGTALELADTDDVSEGSVNLYFTDARARAAISENADILSYDNSTGVLGVVGAAMTGSTRDILADAGSAAGVRGHLSSGYMIDFASGEFAIDTAEFSGSWADVLATKDTDDLAEGSNLYYTDARARAAVSVTDAGGDGSLSYDNSTGVITYTGPSAAEVRAHLSAGEMLDYSGGEFSINAATFSASADVRWDAKMAASDTDALSEGSSNLYFTDARARAAISEDADILSYDNSTGVLSVVGAGMSGSVRDIVADSAAAAAVRGHLSSGYMIDFASGEFAIDAAEFSGSWADVLATKDTDDLAEGSNLYFTQARARQSISVTDAGGDGSLAYDNSTGVITYTGPSAAEVRAHLSAGEMLDYSGGEFSINAATFSASADVRWDAKMAASDTDALSEGSSNLYFTDARARAAISEDADILSYDNSTGVLSVVGAGMSGSVRDIVADSAAAAAVRGHLSSGYMIDFASGEFAIDASEFSGSWADVLATKDTDDLAEGSNLYFTDARARAAISVTDSGGDGSLAYDNSTGVITYTGPSAAEVRAHFTAGDGLAVSAGDFSVNVDDSSIEINSDTLRVKAAGITDAMLNDDVATGLAGVGLSAASGVMALDFNELTEAVVNVAADSIMFLDADGNASRRDTIADLVSAMAGGGLTANNGVLSTDAGNVAGVGDADATLAAGMNFGNATLTADRTWTLPASPEDGQVVHVKAPADLGGNNVIISRAGSQTIDGELTIRLEGPGAAVSLMYVGSNAWAIF